MTLDPDIKDYLDEINANGNVRYSDLPIEELRRTRIELARRYGPGAKVEREENIEIPGSECQIPIRLYYPFGLSDDPGLLIFYHGGGWVAGVLDERDATCRWLADEAKIVVANVDYRLAPEYRFPAAVVDAYDALKWLSQNAQKIGVNQNKIAVSGDSAGGNLAAVVTILSRDLSGPDIAFQLLIYPAVDASREYPSERENATGYALSTENMNWFWSTYLGDDKNRLDPRASPRLSPSLANLPPAHIITAGYDPLRDQGEEYAEALLRAGNKVSWTGYEGAIHTFFCTGAMFRVTAVAVKEAAAHLRNYIG